VLKRQLLADGSPWIGVWRETVRLPDGRRVRDYYTVDQADHVAVFAVTGAGGMLGIWHYKHGPRRIVLGVPAGYVHRGEKPLAAARRELLEETGCKSASWGRLGSFSVDGNRGCGKLHVYLAAGVRKIREPAADDLEECVLEKIRMSDALEHLGKGRVRTLTGAAAIALGLQALKGVSQRTSPRRRPRGI
jgi:ADP-ribose pyrophosphatase